MSIATPTAVTAIGVISPLVVAVVLISLISIPREPARQKFSAVFVAGAGAAYFGGGFGIWEIVFCAVITVLAYRGLADYRAIGVAWLLHSGWDLAHDWYGNPIIPFAPASSFGCFICDPVLALWYVIGAPSIWRDHRRAAAARAHSHAASASRP